MYCFEGLRERFLDYVSYDTMSDASKCGECRPTTEGQERLMLHLRSSLEAMGLETYFGPEKVLMGTLRGIPELPPVAFMAHVDTADDVPGNGVRPVIHENYDGGDIVLGDLVIKASDNPDLQKYRGGTVITSDGTTLLGADDKAGAAAIMEALSCLVSHPEIRHPDIEVFFTPDEETGHGMDSFPYGRMRSRICYTLDGGREGEIETECFNGAEARICITGEMVHFGDARGRLRNAVLAAAAIASALPGSESPEATDGRYGYYCVERIEGTAAAAHMDILIRDFSAEGFGHRIRALKAVTDSIAALYGVKIVNDTEITYRNMRDANALHPEALSVLYSAAGRLGQELHETIIRGGTDVAKLAEHGVASPNIYTGGHNFHSLYEWVPLKAMENAAALVVAIAEEMAK